MTWTFDRFARRSAEVMGSSYAFVTVCGLTVVWLLIGPFVGWSEVWQVTLTTVLTVVTQLTAMLIQNTATRHEKALHTKIDELIRAIGPADNRLQGIEEA